MSVPAYHMNMVKVMGSGANLAGPTQMMEASTNSQRGLGYMHNNSTVNVKMNLESKRGNLES